ncbi:MAG: hypothetical protein WBE26_16740 [Phycisphaerae bacterium]
MFHTLCFNNVVRLAFAATAMCAGVTQDVPQPTAGDTADHTATAPAALSPLPKLPRVRPAPMPGFDDDAAYMRSISERVSELATLADQVGEPTKRTESLLAAVNLILAHHLEPLCTRRILQIPGERDGLGEGELRAALDRAEALIEQANATLQAMHDREDLPAGWLEESTHRTKTLQAFAMALRAYLFRGEGVDGTHEARQAASRLSPLLEDSSRAVVEAATLWQACLRSYESELAPALSRLDPALADPVPQSMPYAFFARLLRCRLIADRGGTAVALGLLMQIEERCHKWLTDDTGRDDAARAAQLMRIQIMADWYDRLASLDRTAERQWCVDRIKKLIDERFGESGDTVLRLAPAIPIIALPPKNLSE